MKIKKSSEYSAETPFANLTISFRKLETVAMRAMYVDRFIGSYHADADCSASVCPAGPGPTSAVSWTFCWPADEVCFPGSYSAAVPAACAPKVGHSPRHSHHPAAVNPIPMSPSHRDHPAAWHFSAASAAKCTVAIGNSIGNRFANGAVGIPFP